MRCKSINLIITFQSSDCYLQARNSGISERSESFNEQQLNTSSAASPLSPDERLGFSPDTEGRSNWRRERLVVEKLVNFPVKFEICSFHESYTTSDPVQYNWRRESFNEDYLRGGGRSTPTGILHDSDRRMSLQEGEDAGSPFVSMPAIPAVYLAVDGEGPLEKVFFYFLFTFTVHK